jgi:hypothetical protein
VCLYPQWPVRLLQRSVTVIAGLGAGLLLYSAIRTLRAAHARLGSSVATVTESAANVMEKF